MFLAVISRKKKTDYLKLDEPGKSLFLTREYTEITEKSFFITRSYLCDLCG